jgi:hypothetical protein
MNSLNRRQIVILAALAIPVIGLMVLSFMGSKKPVTAPTPPPKVEGNKSNATGKVPARPANNKVVLPTYEQLKANINSRWKEAETLTPEKYTVLLRKDPRLPPTLELYRERIKARVRQLEKMTTEQFEAEQRQRAAHLRQRGIMPITPDQAAAGTRPQQQPAAPQPATKAPAAAAPAAPTPATPPAAQPPQQPAP